MSDTQDDRRNALDEFARQSPALPVARAPQLMAQGGLSERTFGAVAVAVHRDETRILSKLKALAAAAGDDWYYRFPVTKKGGGQDWIEGASIKLANDVARIYGNCDVDCRSYDQGDSWLFYARFTDFESGYTLTRPFQQRKNQAALKTNNDRAQDMAFQIGASKAIRNVVVNALQTYADFAFNEARNSLVDKIGKNLEGWRARTIQGIANIPMDIARVEAVIGRAGKDWLAPDVALVIAMMKAISDGMANADDTFPTLDKQVATSESDVGASQDVNKPDTKPEPKETYAAAPTKTEDDAKEAKASGVAKTKATAAEKKPEAAIGAAEPTTEKEWRAYAEAWIADTADAERIVARWKEEKKLRMKCNIDPDVRTEVEAIRDARVAVLQAAAEGE